MNSPNIANPKGLLNPGEPIILRREQLRERHKLSSRRDLKPYQSQPVSKANWTVWFWVQISSRPTVNILKNGTVYCQHP